MSHRCLKSVFICITSIVTLVIVLRVILFVVLYLDYAKPAEFDRAAWSKILEREFNLIIDMDEVECQYFVTHMSIDPRVIVRLQVSNDYMPKLAAKIKGELRWEKAIKNEEGINRYIAQMCNADDELYVMRDACRENNTYYSSIIERYPENNGVKNSTIIAYNEQNGVMYYFDMNW